VSRRWQTLTVLLLLHYLCANLCAAVDDDFIYEDEEEEEPDVDVENGYYNAKGIQTFLLINHPMANEITHSPEGRRPKGGSQ
jgi:hypothetical protein